MSKYREHALFGLFMALPFVPSIFYLFFALIGASICDLDHDNNRHKVNSMLITGVILSVILLLFNSSSISAVLLIVMAIIFYISKHRGFTHTIVGVSILSLLFLFMIMGFISFFNRLFLMAGIPIPHLLVMFITMAIVGFFVISRRYYLLYFIVLGLYLYMVPTDYASIDWIMALVVIFIGSMSHIILDLLTPSGLNLFEPFSPITCHKRWAIVFILIWILCVIYQLTSGGFLLIYPH